ncbi:MAG: cyclic pyranopterin monophosphate synthase MoaC [Candidatus Omnitrophica bacterium CG11_big_fil_rev_8_21_14_0_20_42_13]|uniref:Cyclic pyranopterin monophosphate synthase MoaC n=1 Tax=Candidatus Ghiorseimicrobium undicola TaxID=1974746 RepID=A0A2H0LXV5_9BACT|nr:MAG: cyclic pyranopterin monophosphate synthase MoaC [Candidatus Omnitrophica bacterium CG11_big_fil_rev_8_21_14_0_20_42_13]
MPINKVKIAKKEIKMVDVSAKKITKRRAVALAKVTMGHKTISLIMRGKIKKGDVLAVSTLAGIQAAKKTKDLILLCHPIELSHIDISFSFKKNTLNIKAEVSGQARTGFEMEALSAASVSALNVYDMCKYLDKSISIEVNLLEKEGGKSGKFTRPM